MIDGPNGRPKRRRARRLAHARENAFLPRLSWANRFDHLSALHNQDHAEEMRTRWAQQLRSKASARRIFIHPPSLISLYIYTTRAGQEIAKKARSEQSLKT